MTSHPIANDELGAAKTRADLTKECQASHLGAPACRAAIRDSVCANGHMQHRSRAEVDAYRDRDALLAEVDRLRAENTALEAGLEKAREQNGRTCYETVFWYDGEYEGECELVKYHAGPHFDGLSWWDDDRNEVEAPAAITEHEGAA